MTLIDNLALGFSTALTFHNLAYAFTGCLLGTLIGVLPGLGPMATIALLMPFTYGIEPEGALIMLAAIYYGATYGGSTTAILVNLPGETSSVVTVLDGYSMATQGRAGVALTTAALGSLFAGTVGTLLLAVFALPLVKLALMFGPAEYFSLMALGLVGAVSLGSNSVMKASGMVLLGIVLGLVGTDVNTGTARYTLGMVQLWDGIDFIVLAVGLFAFGEIISAIGNKGAVKTHSITRIKLWPSREDFRRMAPAILRGTGVGSAIGILPGAGLAIASFFAYSLEKRVSRTPEIFGKGAIEGVAGPESANNAAAQTCFIPTLTLGIPSTPTMALMLGALTLHNIQPGPQVMADNPTLFWGLIASMWIGNLMLVILNLPLIGIWVRLLKIPFHVLYPAILIFSCIGVYSVRHSVFDIVLAALFGLLGCVFRKFNCEPAPLMLGFVLGPLLEENFRRTLLLSAGDFSVFVTRPISLSMLLILSAMIGLILVPAFRRQRGQALQGEDS